MKNQLLCTFTKERNLDSVLDTIEDTYHVLYNKIFVFETDVRYEMICSYNVSLDKPVKFGEGTIAVHRKKESNTIYTINALNEIIKDSNNGVLDKTYVLDWNNYRDTILVTNDTGVRRIKIRLHEVIEI